MLIERTWLHMKLCKIISKSLTRFAELGVIAFRLTLKASIVMRIKFLFVRLMASQSEKS